MKRHTLTDSALAALGAGRPDAATLGELRRAELGRLLLLLTEIARSVPAPLPAAADLDDPLLGAQAATHLASLLRGGSPPRAEPAERSGRWLSADHDQLPIRVRLEDTDPRRRLLGLTPTGRLTDAEAGHWQRCLTDAWRLLVDRHRADAAIMAEVLSCVVPVEPDPAARGISATSAHAYGAVAMSAPEDGTVLAVGLLHEVQHSVLNAVSHLFHLHERPDTLGYSPWRNDPRPRSGILHGAYAYLAVTRFWRTEAAATGQRPAAFEFARWRAAVAEVADRLLGDGGLTPVGTRFVTALRDEVRPWLDEPVDPDVARLAGIANADHRLRWRLRAMAVDPADAAALAGAWRRGGPPPPVTSRLVPAPRRALESSARLRLIHRMLRDSGVRDADGDGGRDSGPAAGCRDSGPGTGGRDSGPVIGGRAGGRVAAGDAALLRGDHGTALSAYARRVLQEPGDDAAWTGLALVSDRLERPEVVVAAYRALGDRPDPVEFAAWISG